MNYRHIFHAGNRCDVVKHVVLAATLEHLRAKEKGFAILDTHAGIGFYDLKDSRALKTGESEAGILGLLMNPVLNNLKSYYEVLRKLNPLWDGKNRENFRIYPGSPLIGFHMLREQDRLMACELHPQDAEVLRLQCPLDKRFQIHHRDGYEALGAFLPPPEKRGLVFIDPPYEEEDEFDKIIKYVKKAYESWPGGIYMVWYPVKDQPAIWKFHEQLASSGMSKILCAEFVYEETSSTDHLSGSGLIIINPPWKLNDELKSLFTALHDAWQTDFKGTTLKWLDTSLPAS